MFGKTNKQRIKEYLKLAEKKDRSQLEGEGQYVSSSDSSADEQMDFDVNCDFGGDDVNMQEQFESIVNMEDIIVGQEEEHVNSGGESLYDGCRHNVTEFAMAIMAVSRQKHVPDAVVNEFLHLFRIFLPDSNKVPSSYEKIKKIVKKESNTALVKETITFCASCFKDICTCTKMEKSFLLIFNSRYQIEEILTRYGNTMENYRNYMLEQKELIDIHQSKYYRDTVKKFPNMFPISLYTDGGRYAKTSGYEGWPIAAFALDLPPKLRHKYSNIIIFGYWYSKKKPNWEFIFSKIEISIRFTSNNRDYWVKYLQLIADIPARQSLLSIINVSGYNCCYNCDIRGEHIGHLIFPYADLHPRDPNSFIDKTNGVKGDSVLYEILEMFPEGVVIDLMHSVYRGPVEDDIKRLLKGFKKNPDQRSLIKLSASGLAQLESMIVNMKFPKEYQRRKIRSLAVISNWKASELKLFCLYVVPTALLLVASSENEEVIEAIESMIIYSCAIRILTQAKISEEMLTTAEAILDYWAKNRENVWTKQAMTFKSHENRHLAKQVLIHGPLSTHSAFAGESAIGNIGKDITCHNAAVTVKQIGERMALLRSSYIWLDKNGHPKLKAHFNFETNISYISKRITVPSEEITSFISNKFPNYDLLGEINVNGFAICPFQTTDDTNCFVAVKTENGYKVVKILAILQTFEGLFFCGYSIELLPYADLMKSDGILALNPFAYQYCCYIKKENFVENELVLCSAQSFLAKYVMIDANSFYFFMTLPHPYEHN